MINLAIAFLCGALSILLIGAVMEISRLKTRLSNLQGDFVSMGESWQKCFDVITNTINQHTEIIQKHQSAIDYLTKECNDD